jgi:hypothetical protein
MDFPFQYGNKVQTKKHNWKKTEKHKSFGLFDDFYNGPLTLLVQLIPLFG